MPPHFIIDGLPRTGTTTIAKIINEHPQSSCVIEPYHPHRFGGEFRRMAQETGDINPSLALIRHRWVGMKHVWEPTTGWPFQTMRYLNDSLVLAHEKVIFVRRRNYLKRYVSSLLSATAKYWIGPRNEFLARLERSVLPILDPGLIYNEIIIQKESMEKRAELLAENRLSTLTLYYEDFYRPDKTLEDHHRSFNQLCEFVGLTPIPFREFASSAAKFFNPDQFRWSSKEIYLRLPGILNLEKELASPEIGYLFRDHE